MIPWREIMSWRDDPEVFLMSYPRNDWGIRGKSNFRSIHLDKAQSLAAGAMRDWMEIADAIEAAGGSVIALPAPVSQDLTGLPYTAEAGQLAFDAQGKPFYWLAEMTHPHRKLETPYIEGMMAAAGLPCRRVPGIWEAQGDVIRVDEKRVVHTFGRGQYARSEGQAYEKIADSVSPEHCLIEFHADPWFHGNTFLGVYWDAKTHAPSVIWCPEAVVPGDRAKLEDFLKEVPRLTIEPGESKNYATNALQVGHTVIAPTGLPERVLELWASLGLKVVELELETLFQKGGGAAVCLTNRLWGLEAKAFPSALHYATQRDKIAALAEQYA